MKTYNILKNASIAACVGLLGLQASAADLELSFKLDTLVNGSPTDTGQWISAKFADFGDSVKLTVKAELLYGDVGNDANYVMKFGFNSPISGLQATETTLDGPGTGGAVGSGTLGGGLKGFDYVWALPNAATKRLYDGDSIAITLFKSDVNLKPEDFYDKTTDGYYAGAHVGGYDGASFGLAAVPEPTTTMAGALISCLLMAARSSFRKNRAMSADKKNEAKGSCFLHRC